LGGAGSEAQLRKGRKNAQRYIAVAKTPQAIQDAFERGFLPLVLAAPVAGLEPIAQEKLGEAVAELLKQTEAPGSKAKKQVGEAVRAALDRDMKPNRRRQRLKAAPSVMDPIYALNADLKMTLGVVEAQREEIVRYINQDGNYSKDCRMQVVAEIRNRLERGLRLLTEIKAAVEAEPIAECAEAEFEEAA
jgi:hypothetical protein